MKIYLRHKAYLVPMTERSRWGTRIGKVLYIQKWSVEVVMLLDKSKRIGTIKELTVTGNKSWSIRSYDSFEKENKELL